MSIEFVLPKSGMGIAEGTIVKWLKTEGDAISRGEILLEVETAKATEEVEAPVTGTLEKIIINEGETVDVGTAIALLRENQ